MQMAENNGVDDPIVDVNLENPVPDDPNGEMPKPGDPDYAEPTPSENPEDDEVVITIGEEAPPHDEAEKEAAPQWVKELRKADRDKARKIRELEQQLATKNAPEVPSALGKEPELEDEGIDYDTTVFKQKWAEWSRQKQAHDARVAAKAAEAESAQKAWQTKLAAYNTAKAELKVSDFDDAEAAVLEKLDGNQQGIIVSGAENPERVIYALGKNEAKLKELASIKDPVKYAFAVAKLETQLKVTPRKAPPAPERVVRGSAAAVGINDPKLARLEEAADKSGDRSELIAYKRQLKAKAAA